MPTQLESARAGQITPEMEFVARREDLSPEVIREEVAAQTEAPASASDFEMAHPNPLSSATPATSARRPLRSIGSMG